MVNKYYHKLVKLFTDILQFPGNLIHHLHLKVMPMPFL